MEKEKRSLFQRFLLWREKNIKEKQFILILSFLVGIFTACLFYTSDAADVCLSTEFSELLRSFLAWALNHVAVPVHMPFTKEYALPLCFSVSIDT